MRAAVLNGRGDLRVKEIAPPGPPEPTEVTITVTRASICGTDVSEYRHGPIHIPLTSPHPVTGHRGPLVLGHEFVGVVTVMGADVDSLALGDRVACGAGVFCGRCRACAQGRTNLCERYYTLGLHNNGGLAEQVNAPAAICSRIPAGCPDDNAVLAQPLAVALHALRRGGLEPQNDIVVLGAGGVGLFCVFAARAQGAREVLVDDIVPTQLELAERLGATRLPPEPGRRADIVIEATGAAGQLERATRLVRTGGTVVAVGLPAEPVSLDITTMAVNEIDIVTTLAHVHSVDFAAAVGLLARHDLRWLTTEISLEDVLASGFEVASAAAKVVVRLSSE